MTGSQKQLRVVLATCSPGGGKWEQFLESEGGVVWREPQEESHFMEAVTFSQVIQPACSGPSGRETCPRLGLLVSPELLLLLSIGQTQLEARR